MSDSKRATLITVGASKSAKSNVNKTVRLTINLDESNESKYPELNYKELVIAEERKKTQENGKTTGLDPFSDNDDDVERVARKFEQKYGGKSTYGKKGRSKIDDFADIGAGYDENDSFIDNTDGYDEMVPPECDTLYGGFYINCGKLEFKAVPENQLLLSDAEPSANRRNKRRISSSSSDGSSESSSESSHDEKDKPVVNGNVDSLKTEHRKKKNKKIDKKKAKKKQRTDSSAATSGKQTSDDNAQGDGESVDSRTSQSDSLTSKPAPSSENAVTSDSSRDAENKTEVKLPAIVSQILEECESLINRHRELNPAITSMQVQDKLEPHLFRLDRSLQKPQADIRTRRIAWTRVAKALKISRASLLQRVKQISGETKNPAPLTQAAATIVTNNSTTNNNKRKSPENNEDIDISNMTEEEKEAKIVETLSRLKALIEERTPGMMANYNAECERVQEERKKIQIATAAEGAPHIEKRLPKRRFPWCGRTRSLLLRLRNLCDNENSAVKLLTNRALPMFPQGFVRLPTLLRQADLNKEIKGGEVAKRPRVSSASHQNKPTPVTQLPPSQPFTEPIQFPASLTVTTTVKTSPEKTEAPLLTNDKDKKNSVFGNILNSFALSKDLVVETDERRKEIDKEDLYIPPNSIGSITITPVPNQKYDKKPNSTIENKHKEPLLRVKSPAALNEMVHNKDINMKKEKDKPRKVEKSHVNLKEKQVNSPLHIDTSYQTNKKDPSPRTMEEIPKKQIENMRHSENNIPRPALVPVVHSPTFAKPDKRPPEVKKKKDLVIVSDMDPLAEVPNDPVAIDDSSSDVELIEDSKNTDKIVNNVVPSKETVNNKKLSESVSDKSEQLDEATKEDIDIIMRNIREMEHSQEPTKMNSFGGVISSAKHEASSKSSSLSSRQIFQESRSDRNKFAERTSLNKTDGCNNSITG